MISRTLFIIIGICASQLLFSQTISSEKSEAKFALSNLGFNTVNGTLTGMEGSIDFNPNELDNSSFQVCVKVNTIKTGIDKRDEHLLGEDFFHSEKYPTICFKSESINKTGTSYETTGKLTMHGVTKTVSIPFTFADNTFMGSFIMSRLAFKVGEDTSTFSAGDEIEIEIICITQ